MISEKLKVESKDFRGQLIGRVKAFSLGVIKYVDALPARSIAVQTMGRQVIRSATSIGANIVEAQASPTRKDFTLFMSHALKSANETHYWVSLLIDSGYGVTGQAQGLFQEATELSKILGASVRTLRR